jgi:hypothetical protein
MQRGLPRDLILSAVMRLREYLLGKQTSLIVFLWRFVSRYVFFKGLNGEKEFVSGLAHDDFCPTPQCQNEPYLGNREGFSNTV